MSEEASKARSRARRAAFRTAQALLTVAVTWFILERVGISLEEAASLDAETWTPRWGGLAAASAWLLAGYLVSAAFWGVMVAQLGGPRLALLDAAALFFVANMGRYLPGKVWQIAGLAYLAKGRGVSPGVAASAAVLGQATALGGATLVGGLAFLQTAPGRPRELGVGLLAVVVLGLALVSVPRVFRSVVGAAFRVARVTPPEALERDVTFAARWVGLYALNWLIYATAFWGLVRSFGLPGTVLQVAPAFAAAYVLGYLAIFAPAGLGVREGFLVLFLEPFLGAAALGAAVIARLWTTVVEVVPAAGVAGWFAIRGRKEPTR